MEGGPDSSHGQGGALFFGIALLLMGCAGRYQPEVFHPVEIHSPSDYATIPFEESLQSGIQAREQGDFSLAIQIFSALLRQTPAPPELTYQLAIALEEAQLYSQAVGVYRGISRGAPSERNIDAAFREALCLWQLDEDRAAARALKKIPRGGALELSDRYKLDLALGVSWLRVGKTRRGKTHIIEALNASEGSNKAGFMRALALHALLEHTLAMAARLDLQVREKRQPEHLYQRAALVREAEDHLRRIMQLGEIHWMLQGWLDLGDAYTDFADDLSQAPAPKGLTENQRSLYRQRLHEQASEIERRALLAYDRGVEVAARAGRQDLHAAKTLQTRLTERRGASGTLPKTTRPPQ